MTQGRPGRLKFFYKKEAGGRQGRVGVGWGRLSWLGPLVLVSYRSNEGIASLGWSLGNQFCASEV